MHTPLDTTWTLTAPTVYFRCSFLEHLLSHTMHFQPRDFWVTILICQGFSTSAPFPSVLTHLLAAVSGTIPNKFSGLFSSKELWNSHRLMCSQNSTSLSLFCTFRNTVGTTSWRGCYFWPSRKCLTYPNNEEFCSKLSCLLCWKLPNKQNHINDFLRL